MFNAIRFIKSFYPSLDQYNWSCEWCPIPEHHHTLTQTKEIIYLNQLTYTLIFITNEQNLESVNMLIKLACLIFQQFILAHFITLSQKSEKMRIQYLDFPNFAHSQIRVILLKEFILQIIDMSFNEEQRQKIKAQVQQIANKEQTLPKTYFDLVQKVGDSGKYQFIMMLIFSVMWFVTGILLLSTGFLFRARSFDCKANGLLISQSNCLQYVCKLPEELRPNYYALDDNDFISLATDPEFFCQNSYVIDLVKSFVYFGAFIGYIAISFFSDNYGRRSSMLVSWAICTVGTIVVAVSPNVYVVAAGMFLCGCGCDAGINICFFFFGEVVGDEKRQKYSVIIQIFFCLGAIITTLFFYLINSWRINWIILVAAPTILQMVLIWYYIEETPQFLLKKGMQPTLKAMNRIGKINKGRQQILQIEDIQNVKQHQLGEDFQDKYITPIDLCRFPSLRLITICCSIISFMTYAMYYGPALIIDSIGFNIYITNVMVNLSELVTYVPSYLFIQKIQRRKVGIILFLVSATSALLISFIDKPQDQDMSIQAVLQLILVFVFRACISFFFCFFQVYFCELYPSRARGMGAGIVSAVGTLASTSSPIYLGYLQRNDINVMSIFVLFGIIGLGNLTLLTQTKGVPLKQQIEQVQMAKEKRRSMMGSRVKSVSSGKKKSQLTSEKVNQSSGYSGK